MRDNWKGMPEGWFGSPIQPTPTRREAFPVSSRSWETTAGSGEVWPGATTRLRAVMRKNQLSTPTLSYPEPDFGRAFVDDDQRIADDRDCFEFDWHLRLPFFTMGTRRRGDNVDNPVRR